MITYKKDVLKMLKEKGYSTYELTKNKKISISANSIQDMRHGKVSGLKTLDTVCKLLNVQPGNIVQYIPDPAEPDTPGQGKLDAGNTMSQ